MTTSSRRIVTIGTGITLLAALLTGKVIYFRLTYLGALLLISGWLWIQIALKHVTLHRRSRIRQAQMGQLFEERFEIHNTSRWPRLWLEVIDTASIPGVRGSRVLAMIGGHQSRSYLSRYRLTRRGVFSLGPTILAASDPFGFFETQREFSARENLLVYPWMVDVNQFPALMGLLPGGEAQHRKTSQVTPNAAGVREYAPGDALNRIHWPATARRGRFMVKEFDLDPQADVWIIGDACTAVQAGSEKQHSQESPFWETTPAYWLPTATGEYMVSIAASLSRYYLRTRRAVGLAVAGKHWIQIPPDRGGRQLQKILEALALVTINGDLPLQSLLVSVAPQVMRGSTIVIITPDRSREVAQSVEYLLRRGLRPVVVCLDAASFGGVLPADDLVTVLQWMGAPVYCIHAGEDISAVLSGSSLHRRTT